ncbi:hypothetical protein O181_057285 [Austropuccinia psidii MF-1]|uniref:Uncharacterized protein n=1 Tax=Austropuccinia psidii MF-1 TaxID=1389203 RepID=A0A9Q3HWV5_9BASI|nr:hypothetical protein [Austropuccinia psidii MF-1]
MHPALKVAGVVHIWYYIPLCTIFAQQSNGDVLRTIFHLFNSRSQNTMPMSKEDLSTHQSGNPWRQSEDHSRTPTTCLQELGWYFHSGFFPRFILRGFMSF